MNVLVTGGVGGIGHFTVAHLLASGHSVRIVDRVAESDIEDEVRAQVQGAEYEQVDITDYQALRPHLAGTDAVVHLAAIPWPIPGRDAEIFDINCHGTFNVYLAAADEGITRVVSASSINALGNKFGIEPTPIDYLPMDEVHPTSTTDVYSFSKRIVEETAAYFWRRNGISGVCMRFPWVYNPAQLPPQEVRKSAKSAHAEYAELAAMSAAERQTVLQRLEEQSTTLREQLTQGTIKTEEALQKMRALPYRALLFGLRDFWAILDVRDAAHAIELALGAKYEGSHVLNIADEVNAIGLPTEKLVALFYPDNIAWTRSVPGVETLFSIDAARALIGFVPQHSLRPLFEEEAKT